MKKQTVKIKNLQVDKAPPMQVMYIILLLAYSLITVITPNLGALDSNGPKFLALSLLNIVAFLYLLTRKEPVADIRNISPFIKNKIGLAYTLFMGMILISFTKAINIPESILSFSKYSTVFFMTFILFAILRSDKRYLKILVYAMAILLLADSLTVFYNIFLYISKQIHSISDIKSVYSNKGNLASAIFIKIPFVLWIASFEKGWLKKLSWVILLFAEIALFFMSSRSFYLGLIFLVLFYSAYILIINKRNLKASYVDDLLPFFGTLLIAFLIFSFTQRYLYPKTSDTYNVSISQRLSTIVPNEISADARLESWERSALLFRQDPLLGVGTGNWKIQVLKYENPAKSHFTLMVRNHNDFIEITTETGIVGGLLYISMFVFILFNFFAKLFKPEINKDAFYYLFVPAFGIFCYSFDAFFNFPTDRPEIQAIFALFIASGIAYSSGKVEDEIKIHVWIRRSIILILVILLSITSYILLLNFNSLKLQRLVKEDLLSGKLTHPASLFIEGFPSIPTISNSASPIAVYKSGYLINEGKYQEAIKLLRPDRSSPYDSWREYLMAEAFEKLGNPDSALVYAYKAHHLKPRYYTTLNFICIVLEAQGKQEEAISNMKSFLKLENKNRDAWLYLSSLYIKNNNPEMATLTIDSALINLPGDSSILHEKGRLNHAEEALPNQLILSKAMEYYKLNKFNEALFYLNKFIEKEQGVGIAYAGRAYCYFNFKNYSRCIEDINSSINLGNDTPDLMNLRGVCFHELGNSIAACKDFQNAAARGDKNAVKSLQQFCKGN